MRREPSSKRGKKWKFFFGVNFFLFLFLSVAFGREYVSHMQVEREIAKLEEENTSLEQGRLETVAFLSQLASPYYLEGEARLKQGLAEEGETLVVVAQPQVTVNSLADAEVAVTANPVLWFYYFFNHEYLTRLPL
ncbi:MAG: septum formation initiator family protein [Patescibacteria group bacterium]|jgi:cell division protein FtsB